MRFFSHSIENVFQDLIIPHRVWFPLIWLNSHHLWMGPSQVIRVIYHLSTGNCYLALQAHILLNSSHSVLSNPSPDTLIAWINWFSQSADTTQGRLHVLISIGITCISDEGFYIYWERFYLICGEYSLAIPLCGLSPVSSINSPVLGHYAPALFARPLISLLPVYKYCVQPH